MRIYGEFFDEITVDSFELIEEKLRQMNNTTPDDFIVCIRDNSEDYIQVANDIQWDGQYIDFLVEVRLYKSETNFTHHRATHSLQDSSQTLKLDNVIELFRSFYYGYPLNHIADWEDITDEMK